MYQMIIGEEEKRIMIDMCDVFLRQTGIGGIAAVNKITTAINQARPMGDFEPGVSSSLER